MQECQYCGEEHHEDAHGDPVIIRDGWRGQYLAPTEVLDIAALIGEDKVPADVRAAADRWIGNMGPVSDDDSTPEDTETVLDWLTDHGESLLWDAGYCILSDDGYVIVRAVDPGEDGSTTVYLAGVLALVVVPALVFVVRTFAAVGEVLGS